MNRILQVSAAMLLPLAMTTIASAQQLLQPTVPASTQPLPASSSAGPQLKQATPLPPSAVPAAPGARPSAAPIRDQGPADATPAPAIRKAATVPSAASAKVLDSAGVPLAGYIQVAPNRVYDPASQRYYWTVPAGGQQKIVK